MDELTAFTQNGGRLRVITTSYMGATDANNAEIYTMDIRPYPYQQEILDKLDAERNVRGYTYNLVVAATEHDI